MENGFFINGGHSTRILHPHRRDRKLPLHRRGSAADHPDSFDLALAIDARLPRHPDGPRGAQPAERGAWRGACRAGAPPCRGRQHDRGAAGLPAWPKVHPCRKCTLAWAPVPPHAVSLAAVVARRCHQATEPTGRATALGGARASRQPRPPVPPTTCDPSDGARRYHRRRRGASRRD